jgi:hypothetical protein
MEKNRRLRDAYRFPGFLPQEKIFGIFGDPKAGVIVLKRRGKKQFVGPVAIFNVLSTTGKPEWFGICPVGICGFT